MRAVLLAVVVFAAGCEAPTGSETSEPVSPNPGAPNEMDGKGDNANPLAVVQLEQGDYDWIVAANKGTLEQLDNVAHFKTFNVDHGNSAAWSPEDLAHALGALLLHHKGRAAGERVDVAYLVYDGTRVREWTTSVDVVQQPDFDVIEYPVTAVEKRTPTQVWVHYMPWFASKDVDGYWGSHWTMATRDPEVVDATGRREIASHYYPVIGPYSSNDPDLVEYHTLLMRLSGIDGVLIDWYGTWDVNDYPANLRGSNALIDRTASAGLDFGIVYEDRTTEKVVQRGKAATAIEAAIADFEYVRDTYFSRPNYIEMDGNPLLLTFTPVHIESGAAWGRIQRSAGIDPTFLAIWGESGDLGAYGDGEFSWVSTHAPDHLGGLEGFYRGRAGGLQNSLGSAYPGFKGFYFEGGWADHVGGDIEHDGIQTLRATLALTRRYERPAVQLVTWNDFGEGTMLEPTREFGYAFLEEIQQFAGVSHTVTDLEYVEKMYRARKALADDEGAQRRLDQAFAYMVSGQVWRAKGLIDLVEAR